jgi:hypothetical protein
LELTCRQAGLSGLTERFLDKVFERLEKGAKEYGENSFMERGKGLTAEIAEEATDLSAWAVLMAQYTQAQVIAGTLDGDTAMMVQARLMEASANGLRAWSAVAAVEDLLAG